MAKTCYDMIQCSIPYNNDEVKNQHGKISCSKLYKILCVAHACKATLELILHDTSFAIVMPAYSQSVRDWVIIYCTAFVNASTA